MNNLQFTKNDIWRALGFILVIAGQFMSKESYDIFGFIAQTNMVQWVGAGLVFYPFIVKVFAFYKNKKQDNNSQG
jgi:hypothetical protein